MLTTFNKVNNSLRNLLQELGHQNDIKYSDGYTSQTTNNSLISNVYKYKKISKYINYMKQIKLSKFSSYIRCSVSFYRNSLHKTPYILTVNATVGNYSSFMETFFFLNNKFIAMGILNKKFKKIKLYKYMYRYIGTYALVVASCFCFQDILLA